MSQERRLTIMDTEQGESLRAQIFDAMLRVSAVGALVLLLFIVVMGFLVAQFPALYTGVGVVAFLILVLVSAWLNGRKHESLAVTVYLASLTAVLFTLVYFAQGVTGPIAVVLVTIPVTAQLIGGRFGIRWVSVVGLIYVVLLGLEISKLLQPRTMTPTALYSAFGVFFIAAIVITANIVRVFQNQAGRALTAAQGRERELAEAIRSAQQAAYQARDAREQEERSARQLRQAVQMYVAFLERVTAGDYAARLSLEQIEAGKGTPELVTLGNQLNATVESLLGALQELQLVQRRYAREAWTTFAATRATHRGFQFRDDAIEPNAQAWLPPIAQAVQEKRLATGASELALPLTLRGEVIGAIGAQRKAAGGWSDDDLALIQAISDQLTQTIEGLRLLDETQRRAAHERLLNEITARIRNATTMDAILDSATREIGQVTGAGYVAVDLTLAQTE